MFQIKSSQMRTEAVLNRSEYRNHCVLFSIDKSKALSLVVHCADISHPAKDLALHINWTERLLEEFFRQVRLFLALQIHQSKCDKG